MTDNPKDMQALFCIFAGADPGIFVRGSNLPKIVDKQKKKWGRGEGRGVVQYLFCFSMVDCHWNSFNRQYFFYKYDIPWYFLHAKITFEMIVLALKMCKWCHSGTVVGGSWAPPPEFVFVSNGVKSCNFRLSWKPGRVCMTGERITLLNLEVFRIFQTFTLCIIHVLTSEESQKKYIKEDQNNLWTASPTHQISTQDPTSDKSQRGPDHRSPSGSAHVFGTINDNMKIIFDILSSSGVIGRVCRPVSMAMWKLSVLTFAIL